MHRSPRVEQAPTAARTHTLAQFSPREPEPQPEPEPEPELEPEPEPESAPEPDAREPAVHAAAFLPRARRPITPPHTAATMAEYPELKRSVTPTSDAVRSDEQQEVQSTEGSVATKLSVAYDRRTSAAPAMTMDDTSDATPIELVESLQITALQAVLPAAMSETETTNAQRVDTASQGKATTVNGAPSETQLQVQSSQAVDCDIDLEQLSKRQLVRIVRESVLTGAQSPLLVDLINEQRTQQSVRNDGTGSRDESTSASAEGSATDLSAADLSQQSSSTLAEAIRAAVTGGQSSLLSDLACEQRV